MKTSHIALLSDFGVNDPFVAAMKGVIYSKNKKVSIIDITHNIPPQDIKTCAFYLMVTMQYMPKNTLFVAVVDPFVGTGRASLWVKTKNYQFLTPDNGIISWLEEKEKIIETRSLNNSSIFLEKISMTFHGRDILAPAAAEIAAGLREDKIGPVFSDYRKFPYPHPARTGNKVTGEVIAVDHFGNVITNITREYISINSVFTVAGKTISGLKPTYASVPEKSPLCVIGAFDYLEFSVRNGNFSKEYGVKIGDRVEALVEL
ncbi:MAG: SAM-dependent chlorinase/fluorinase [Elusimicrobiota bacterium]